LSRRALERSHFTQKAAEDKAAVARRKCEHAEHELLLARAEIEKLRERVARVQKEADQLHALEDRHSRRAARGRSVLVSRNA
jgi:hypothetical protein